MAAMVPHAVLEQPLDGKGSVAQAIERSIRIRFDGNAEPSQRSIVPETQAAVDLLGSPAGPTYERAMRAIASVADGHQGADDLKTITLYPDERSTLGGAVLDRLDIDRRDGQRIAKLDNRQEARRYVRDATEGELEDLAFRAAVNRDGHIGIAPDVSREFLSTLGLYVPKDGDDLLRMPADDQRDTLAESWKTVVHETHHSVTPETSWDDEAVNVLEESVPTVMERLQGPVIAAKAGADIEGEVQRLGYPDGGAADAKAGAVQWGAWNRDRLPAPPDELEETAGARYTDGPELVERLVKLAGIDTSTPEGIAQTDALLQGERAKVVPQRIAAAIAKQRGLSVDHEQELAELIHDAAGSTATIKDIERLLAD
jgi:hypothetical protein